MSAVPVIVVTGGFGALGRALGQVLRAQGAQVALLDAATAPDAGALPDDDGLMCLGQVRLDEPEAARVAMAQVLQWHGRLDGLVNVAGGFQMQDVAGGDLAIWEAMYRSNLRSAVCSTQAALPALLASGGGCVVNVGAAAAERTGAGMGAYAAAKAGVARFTEALAEEFKASALRVHAVLPSLLDTPANRAAMPDADASRWVTPTALAKVVAFLLSPEAEPLHGALIPARGRV
ncbi:SDR family NAD(P)-dependent oxidoreductase [Inhella crocodyli]|uniref:SDR family NAD(P)-dependent oxidoreductase n=1 Tax=Inhella crocodyli TaxID=2499851 RepID=A0A3S2XXA9_9BURK|nr:SDR family NAD(P)-dependent oxidoreductase [Inhella crocodyli]RVT88626.1 SDR family NAD(P)-dependent oxidoreductase [Inhella crocodyli]